MRDVNLLIGQAEADPQGDPARWHSAREAFKRAEDLLGPLIDAASRRRVKDLGERIATSAQAAERDAALLREAVDIRSAQEDDPDGSVSDSAYARAFREAKLDVDALGPDAVGVKIRARPVGVSPALVAALDDWSSQRRKARPEDVAGWKRLIDAARVADPDTTRDRLRQLWSEFDRKAHREPLLELAKAADPKDWPAANLMLLAGALSAAGEREAAVDLLRRAQAHHPGDVWINYNLGSYLEELHPPQTEEAIRFYSVARALRPRRRTSWRMRWSDEAMAMRPWWCSVT